MSMTQDKMPSSPLAPNPLLEVQNQEMRQSICDGLKQLWQSQALFDYTLVAEGCSFQLHKVVLASASDYFYAMFTSGMKETQQDYVELKAINSTMLQLLLDYVYTGILHITDDNVGGILNAASHLQISTAIKACLSFIDVNLSVGNCVEILDIARLFLSDRHYSKVEDFVAENFSSLIESGNYLLLSFESFKSLLCREELMFGPEENIYQAVVQWLEHKPEKRKKYQNCLMEHIRFPLMTANHVNAIIKSHSELMTDPVLNKSLKEAQEYLSKPVHQRVLCQNSHTRLRMKPCLLTVYRKKWFALSKDKGKWYNVRSHDVKADSAACIIVNDFLLMCGGTPSSSPGDVTGKCYIFDPRECKWTQLASMCVARLDFSLVQHKGFLYSLGGGTDDEWSEITREIERYSYETNQWELFAKMHDEWNPVITVSAACVVNDSIYTCDGDPESSTVNFGSPNPMAVLDIISNTWKMASMKEEFSGGLPMWSQGDLIYSVQLDDYFTHDSTPTITWYDPKTGDTGLLSLPEKLPSMANIVVDNERVYFIHGTIEPAKRRPKYGLCTEVVLKEKSVQAINHLDPFPSTEEIDYLVQLRFPWHQFIFNEDNE